MVICIVALVAFSILGIWSARYRDLARQSFRCVYLMATFRPCDVHLETKIKTKLTAKLMFIPSLARFFYKNFKVISWVFTIAFFTSMGYSAYGIYNLVFYGSCQPGSTCIINQGTTQIVRILTCYEAYIVYGIIIIVLITLLSIRYLNIEFKIKR